MDCNFFLPWFSENLCSSLSYMSDHENIVQQIFSLSGPTHEIRAYHDALLSTLATAANIHVLLNLPGQSPPKLGIWLSVFGLITSDWTAQMATWVCPTPCHPYMSPLMLSFIYCKCFSALAKYYVIFHHYAFLGAKNAVRNLFLHNVLMAP